MSISQLLFDKLKDKPHPLFVFNDTVIPAATIWVGVRAWTKYFRELGLVAGDRILLSYPESPAFIHILFASVWEKLTISIIRPDTFDNSIMEALDARLAVTLKDIPYSVCPDEMGMPPEIIKIRSTRIEKFPDIRFILQSSGSTGNPKFICLTEEGILSVIQSHSVVFKSSKAVVLSVLPWSHCFGLVLDLFLSIFHAECIVRDPEGGKNLDSILSLFSRYDINHFSSVPLVMERILKHDKGNSFLAALESGIIGGAPIANTLAQNLSGSNLRVGYGQTEASPGICLGEEGVFFPNYIGNPVDCEVQIIETGELLFRGQNSFSGYWKLGINKPIAKNIWIGTGDLVQRKDNGLYFLGRLDFSFKLPNGIMIQPEIIEDELKAKALLSECLVLFSDQLRIYFYHDTNQSVEQIIPIIQTSIPRILKSISVSIHFLSREEWIFSPKGGINRKLMLEKLRIP